MAKISLWCLHYLLCARPLTQHGWLWFLIISNIQYMSLNVHLSSFPHYSFVTLITAAAGESRARREPSAAVNGPSAAEHCLLRLVMRLKHCSTRLHHTQEPSVSQLRTLLRCTWFCSMCCVAFRLR